MIRKEQDNRIYTATLKERNRIAREIHDNVGHMLHQIHSPGWCDPDDQQRTDPYRIRLSDLRATLDTAMNSIRSSVHDLHDESIDTKAAIQDMLNDITGFHTSFEYDMGNIVPKDIQILSYQHCQRSDHQCRKAQQRRSTLDSDPGTSGLLSVDDP